MRTMIACCILLAGCSAEPDGSAQPPEVGETASLAALPDAAAAKPAAEGFDPASAPVASPSFGAWPYFSLIDGYTDMTAANSSGDSAKQFLRDAAFDEYQLFDGYKLNRVEGRLSTRRANGKGASFFEVKKTYEQLMRDAGGVTVFEGSGAEMAKRKLTFADARHRAYWLEKDEMGVYMIRLPDRQLWVEAYKPYGSAGDNYWLTVVETKPLAARASVLPAADMKRSLDAAGRVALYVTFDTDKAAIKPESAPLVAEIVKLLKGSPELSVYIDGHTDDVGTPARNRVLAQDRARSVVAELTAAGIDPRRLTARGFGSEKPLSSNADEEGRAKNRRVELVKR